MSTETLTLAAPLAAGVLATELKGEYRRGGMPSGHAAATAALLTVVLAKQPGAALPCLVLGGLVVEEATRYHTSDELNAGLLLGAGIGLLAISL